MDPSRPALPLEIEPDPEHVLISEDGKIREHYNLIYSADDAERIRLGYCCINCGESQHDHGAPNPKACWVCRFPMRDKQLERYGKEFKGEVRLGPSTSIEEELAIAEELVEKRELHQLGMKKTNSIVVPGWANA